jgi:ERCC4-related helicase
MPQIISLRYPDAPFDLATHLGRQLDALHMGLYDDIGQDPYVVFLKSQRSGEYDLKLDQKLNNAVNRGASWCQEQINSLLKTSRSLTADLGYYSLYSYLKGCMDKVIRRSGAALNASNELREEEIAYVSKALSTIEFKTPEPDIGDSRNHSPKVQLLMDTLCNEMRDGATGIVFVKTRATVRLLSDLLSQHPRICDILKVGTFVGGSTHRNRSSHISELIDASGQEGTLDELRLGTKNLIIATNVLEEGIDISACNLVICFDRPDNVRSFIQRRGRARKAQSRLIILFSAKEEKLVKKWHFLEEEMKAKYADDMRELEELKRLEEQEEGYREYVVASTG